MRESDVQSIVRGDSELEVTKTQDVDLEIDGIEVKTKAGVVILGNFNEAIVLGKNELRCWNVGIPRSDWRFFPSSYNVYH